MAYTAVDPATGLVTCLCGRGLAYDATSNSCGASSSSMHMAGKRKAKRARALLLQSLKSTPWQGMDNEVLCPDGQTACPILPSMESYECIDVCPSSSYSMLRQDDTYHPFCDCRQTSSELDSCGGCRTFVSFPFQQFCSHHFLRFFSQNLLIRGSIASL